MSVETALVLCRFLHFCALFAWFGRMLYVCVIAAPAHVPRVARDLTSRTREATRRLACLTLLTACLLVPVQTAEMSGGWDGAFDPTLWLAVLGTPFGTVWRWHLLLSLLATALALAEPRQTVSGAPDSADARRLRPLLWLACIATGVLLATLGLEGHAAMLGGWVGALQRANHATHLLSTAAWAGMLPMLLPTLSALDGVDNQAQRTLQRFSTAGHIAVALALATGAANIAFILGTVPWIGTVSNAPYRTELMVKCLLVAAMIGIALVNRYAIVPAMRRVATGNDAPAVRQARIARLQRGFTWLTCVEIGVALAVVWLVSDFATRDPH